MRYLFDFPTGYAVKRAFMAFDSLSHHESCGTGRGNEADFLRCFAHGIQSQGDLEPLGVEGKVSEFHSCKVPRIQALVPAHCAIGSNDDAVKLGVERGQKVVSDYLRQPDVVAA